MLISLFLVQFDHFHFHPYAAGPSVLRNFKPGRDGIFQDGINLFFHPGIFLKKMAKKLIKVFEIKILFDMINPKKSRDYIFQNPGIGIWVQSRDPAGAWSA